MRVFVVVFKSELPYIVDLKDTIIRRAFLPRHGFLQVQLVHLIVHIKTNPKKLKMFVPLFTIKCQHSLTKKLSKQQLWLFLSSLIVV